MKRIDFSKAKKDVFEIDGVKYTLRPMPFSRYRAPELDEEGQTIMTMEAAWVLFDGCLAGWDGLEDGDGKPVVFNKQNKRYIFDYIEDVREPLLKEILNRLKDTDEEVKN